MPIWLIILMILGILVGFGLAIYATSLVPPLSYILAVVAVIIIATAILGPTIANVRQKITAAEALKSSGVDLSTPTQSFSPPTGNPPECHWVWTDKIHDPTDEFGNRLLADEPVSECEQVGWGVEGEGIPPYCWCGN